MTHLTAHRLRGFTLIELIVVMVLMTTILAIAAPRLSDFVVGRNESSEVRRILALTRFARSEAIGRSQRMVVWINAEEGRYGLRAESGSTIDTTSDSTSGFSSNSGGMNLGVRSSAGDTTSDSEDFDPDHYTYQVADKLGLQVQDATVDENGETQIVFLPDGTVDPDNVPIITVIEQGEARTSITLSDTGMQFIADSPDAVTGGNG